MKKSIYHCVFVAIILLISGCSNDPLGNNNDAAQDGMTDENNNILKGDEQSDSSFPVTVKMDGKEITVETEPKNIIPLSLEVAEIVLELVDPSRVIAATRGLDDPYLSTKASISHEIP